MKKWIASASITLTALAALVGCNQAPIETEHYSFGDTAEFETKAISLGSDVTWVEADGEEAFKLPVVITNLDDENEAITGFFWATYGPEGEINVTMDHLFEGSLSSYDYIPPGESLDSFIVVKFEGDGEYHLTFSNYRDETVDIRLDIAR